MKTCQNCIHADVCRIRQFPSMYGLTGDACEHYNGETDARRTLRLIYADILGNANRCRAKSEKYIMENKPESAYVLRRESEIRASDASRVKHFCRMIGFDPSAKNGGESE